MEYEWYEDQNDWAKLHFSGPLCAFFHFLPWLSSWCLRIFKLAFCRQLKWLNASLRLRCIWPSWSRQQGSIFWQEKVWEVFLCKWKKTFKLSANRLRRLSPQDLFRMVDRHHQREGFVPCGSNLNVIFKRIFCLGRFWAIVN